jgi:hypothetical protein
MRELPFGARISDSFVEFLRRQIVKAHREMPGTSPCLTAYEKAHDQTVSCGARQATRIDLFKDPKFVPINRLAPPAPHPKRPMIRNERVWLLVFDKHKHPVEATFNIDGMQLHISKRVQAELKNAKIFCVYGNIVVKHVHI